MKLLGSIVVFPTMLNQTGAEEIIVKASGVIKNTEGGYLYPCETCEKIDICDSGYVCDVFERYCAMRRKGIIIEYYGE